MSYTRKPGYYTPAMIRRFVKLAVATTICAASRKTGVSTFTIRRHLILAGHTPAKRGKRARIKT